MKLLNMLLFFTALMFSVMIFDYHPIDSSGTLVWSANYTNYTSNDTWSSYVNFNGTYYSSNIIWEALLHPYKGAQLAIVAFLILVATYIVLINFFNIIGFNYRSDVALMGIIFILIIGIGLLPTAVLYNFLNREIGALGFCSAAMTSCWFSEMIAGIIAGPILVMWIFASLEWWTQRSVSN